MMFYISKTANCDFLGVQAGRSEYRLVQKRLELVIGWAEPRSTCEMDAAGTPPICYRVGIFEQAGPKLINE